MRKFGTGGIGIVLLAIGALWAVQMHSLRETRARVEALEARMAEMPGGSQSANTGGGTIEGADLSQRLAALESIVLQSGSRADQRAASGARLPGHNLEELRRKLLDPSVSEKDRLQALRLLRRNGGLTDDALASAINWLQTSPDAAMRREILQQLGGVTNAVLRQPLLDLAATSTDPKVRDQAVENLRQFVTDAEVEKRLWAMAQSDPDPKVREQAEEALRKGPMTPERAGRLQQIAADSQASLDTRLTALQALHRAGIDVADASAAIAELVQNSPDPVARAKVFRALDGVLDPRLLPPLVNGLQDPSPVVRQEAIEALGRFTSDPNVRQWLEYMAQYDADPRVKREAFQVLKKLQ